MRLPLRRRFRWLGFASFVTYILATIAAVPAQVESTPEPRLAVVIAIDQFRGDYLRRFGPYFGKDGFNRLLAGGTQFLDCYYRHGVTKTAPGHATLLSGTHADTHGIISNAWYDHASGRIVESVEDASSPIVGAATTSARSPGGVLEAKSGRSPLRFMAGTVGDELKLRFGARSRIFSVSNKDRSAILLGGKLADSVYWMDRGRLVTSTYYRTSLPSWVEAFNAEQRVEKAFGQTWNRLLDPSIYERVQGDDDAAGETTEVGLGRTFPRRLDGGRPTISPDFFSAFDHSPLSSALIGEFAGHAVRDEQLGQDEITDLLCVSFSQIDTVGHSYGPDSHEIMDSVLRLDRVIATFLNQLDQEVGLKRCVIVLSADHGASPLPERVSAQRPGLPEARFDGTALDAAVTATLNSKYGPLSNDGRWFIRDNFGYYLLPSTLSEKNLRPDIVSSAMKEVLAASPQVACAFTRTDVLGFPLQGDGLEAMLRRSYYPPVSQDVIFVLKPYIVDRKNGSNHGTPYPYDTHVPLIFFGAGVPHSTVSQRVGADDVAPTLAALLGLPCPPQSVGHRLF